MRTTITQQGIVALEFPIAQPALRYPVIGKMDGKRIVTHEPRFELWMTDDIVNVNDVIWHVVDFGQKRGGFDITAKYADWCNRAEQREIDATEFDASAAGQ